MYHLTLPEKAKLKVERSNSINEWDKAPCHSVSMIIPLFKNGT
jgi:hypothetical protein